MTRSKNPLIIIIIIIIIILCMDRRAGQTQSIQRERHTNDYKTTTFTGDNRYDKGTRIILQGPPWPVLMSSLPARM